MEPDHTAHDAAMARLEAFIGEWVMRQSSQRYSGTFSADGQRIDGRWESAGDGATSALDFHLNYTKVR